jgi:hypothetical protein
MQTRFSGPRGHFFLVLAPLCLIFAGCGGSSRDAMEKRLSSLQEEVTHLQNSNDRLAERLQALEIQGLKAGSSPAKAEVEPEDTRVVRPQLRVVKVGPAGEERAEDAPPAAEAVADESNEPRPVIKDHGAPPLPPWAKARARTGAMGQTRSGAVRKNPQGT